MDGLVKRKTFLEKFEREYRKTEKFYKHCGGDFVRKIERLLVSPKIYIPYVLASLHLLKNYKPATKLFWDKNIVFNLKDRGAALLHSNGLLLGEYCLTKFFIKNLKENDVFYDIGANHGFYTYLALEFCKEIHSFEPLPDLFEELRENLREKSNIFLNDTALSDINGETFLYLSISSGLSTINKDVLNMMSYRNKINVKTLTLDEYLKDHSKPTVLKIDVEGAESMVIEGGKEFFKNNSPVITAEIWLEGEHKKVSLRTLEILESLGYQPYCINLDGEIEKIDRDFLRVAPAGEDNFIFLKK